VLESLGLGPALERCASEFSAAHGVESTVTVLGLGTDKPRLPGVVETNVYRIVQEVLSNVARHADAKTVSVFVCRETDQLRVVIEDDGRGFAINDEGSRAGGMGLVGIRERAELLRGTARIESSPGAGTTVVINIPARPTTS
jgi:signal transduction histidine kinase